MNKDENETEIFNGYITKYAMGDGIYEAKIRRFRSRCSVLDDCTYGVFELNKEVFRTKEEAEQKAKQMAMKRIKSLEKQLEKAKKLAKEPKWNKKRS